MRASRIRCRSNNIDHPSRAMKTLLILLSLLVVNAAFPAAKPLVIAHRGASGYLPEHTLPAKALAVGLGADYIEQDVVLTKDGVPVVLHDIEIDSVTDVATRFPDRARSNGRFYAIDFTLAELRQLRVKERVNMRTGDPVYPRRFPVGQSTFAIHTLEEELQFIQGLNRSLDRHAGVYPEIKAPLWHRAQGQDISAIVLGILAQYGYATKDDAFFLQCFEFEEVKRLRTELGFRGRLVQLIGRYGGGEIDAQGETGAPKDNTALLQQDGLAEVARYADGIGPILTALFATTAEGTVRPDPAVARAQALSLLVHPYTLRTDALPKFAATANELLDLLFRDARVDGVFTDHPDVVRDYLRKAGKN